MDTRGDLLTELEKFRYKEVFINNQATRNTVSNNSTSQKHFFSSSKTARMTSKTSGSQQHPNMARKHPLLDVKLGKEFDTLKHFKVVLEGDFGLVEITESCLLELQKIVLPRIETLMMTVSIYTTMGNNQTGQEEQPSVTELYGLKHCEVPFSKESVVIKVLCGPLMNKSYNLTFRLYG